MVFVMSLCWCGFANTSILRIKIPENTTDVSVSFKDYKAIVFKFGTNAFYT